MLALELSELAEMEAAIDDAEEEELWALTLSAQFNHISVGVHWVVSQGLYKSRDIWCLVDSVVGAAGTNALCAVQFNHIFVRFCVRGILSAFKGVVA